MFGADMGQLAPQHPPRVDDFTALRCGAFVLYPVQGLQIHGNEASPLFEPNDPFWSLYQNNAKFVPKPNQYTKLDSRAMVMHSWTFNKTAWVMQSQVRSHYRSRTNSSGRACGPCT